MQYNYKASLFTFYDSHGKDGDICYFLEVKVSF